MLLQPVAYDPAWPTRFKTLQAALSRATGLPGAQIAHIGSTSVPGLRAKPIIDIQIGVRDLDAFDLDSVTPAGFVPAPEITGDDPFRPAPGDAADWRKKYARREDGGRRSAHLHIRQIGHANHRLALLFRDFLRGDPETCRLYAEFKTTAARIGAAASDEGGSGVYLDLKDPFVKLVICRAEDWAARTGWRVPG